MVKEYYEKNLSVVREKQARCYSEKSFVVNEAWRKHHKKEKYQKTKTLTIRQTVALKKFVSYVRKG